MSKLFLESLDNNRLDIFNKLDNFKELGMLGGGTALALQINHRKSYDFDMFVKNPINKSVWRMAKEVFGRDCVKTLESEDQLNLITPNGIKVTFFYDDYESLFEPIRTQNIELMNTKDIATNKAMIQGKRPKWRDYVDLYFILKNNHVTLNELIDLSIKKFGNDFSEKLFLEQLVYFEDIRDYTIEFIGEEVSKEDVKQYLESEVKNFKNKSLK
jgi:hypothetical protein